MKTNFPARALVFAFCILHSALFAASPLYTQMSDGGNDTAGAEVIFPSDGLNQIHLISLNWNSDHADAVASLTTGAGLYKVGVTNHATTSTTNQINRTNGLVAGSVLVVERGGVAYAATMSSFNSNATWGNYVVLASGGWGVLTTTNDPVYQMSAATTLPIGATTNNMQGDTLYAGTQGRPVRVVLTPATATNRLNAVVVRYGGGVGSVTNMELTVVEGGGTTLSNLANVISTNLLVTAVPSATIGGTNLLEVVNQATNKVFQVGTNGLARFATNIIAPGSVIQTVWAQKTDTLVNNVAATWTNILTAAITPKVLGSRMVVTAQVTGNATATYQHAYKISTNNVAIMPPDSPGSRLAANTHFMQASGVNYVNNSFPVFASDVPGSMSDITYQLQGWVEASGVMYINRSEADSDSIGLPRGTTTMMIQEIAP